MRVAVSVEVDDDYRKALAYRIDSRKGTLKTLDPAKMRLATRKEIKNELSNHLDIEMGEVVREVGIEQEMEREEQSSRSSHLPIITNSIGVKIIREEDS